LYISLYSFLFCFPAPIILALLLNEVRCSPAKRIMQTISYLPHFISTVIMVGLVKNMVALDGPINHLIEALGGNPITFLSRPEWFRTINVVSDIWQGVGWGSIIYMAALAGVPMEQYEAAIIDGANRWQQTWNITIPAIMPTIIVMLIIRIGYLMDAGFEQVYAMLNSLTRETGEIIGTYVYRLGFGSASSDYGLSTAVGLFNGIISLILILGANYFSKKKTGNGVW
jgi:putative aldouronate transport system permease protein